MGWETLKVTDTETRLLVWVRAVVWHKPPGVGLSQITVYTDGEPGHLKPVDVFDFPTRMPVQMLTERPAMTDVASLIGATWLLMSQESISERETVNPEPKMGHKGRVIPQSSVQLIDVKHRPSTGSDRDSSKKQKEYHVRWLVRGHWRQVPYGPKQSLRKPMFIAPHVKGPEGAPMKTDRVNIWRRE